MPLIEPSMFCRQCGYVLNGLSVPRCPECGRDFDPCDPSTYYNSPRHPWWRAAAGAVHPLVFYGASWAAYLFAPLMTLVFGLCGMGIACSLIRRRWVLTMTGLALCPISLLAAWTTIEYLRGTASQVGYGYATLRAIGVDPTYRCVRSNGGCLVSAREQLNEAVNNWVLHALIRRFGLMRGSYDGPFPTQAEALAALGAAEDLSIDDLRANRAVIGNRVIRMDPDVFPGITSAAGWFTVIGSTESDEEMRTRLQVKGVLYQTRCLILRIPRGIQFDHRIYGSDVIALIDAPTGRPFAYYTPEGSVLGVFAPGWRR